MSEEMKSGMRCAVDNLETEQKIVYASQEVDIQITHLRPWLEYRKVAAEKWLNVSSNYPDIKKALEQLLDSTNKEIAKLLGL